LVQVSSHKKWLDDVVAHCENKITIDFPIIADPTREISVKYGMLDPTIKDKEGLPLTCRAVFIIGGHRILISASLLYPYDRSAGIDAIPDDMW
jgi:1-Cys peroxiredoxin 6